MARSRFISTLRQVAAMIGENLELIEEVTANSDNISEGELVYVSDGSEDGTKGLTENGIDELQSLLADIRTWDGGIRQFLIDGQCDPEMIERVIADENETRPITSIPRSAKCLRRTLTSHAFEHDLHRDVVLLGPVGIRHQVGTKEFAEGRVIAPAGELDEPAAGEPDTIPALGVAEIGGHLWPLPFRVIHAEEVIRAAALVDWLHGLPDLVEGRCQHVGQPTRIDEDLSGLVQNCFYAVDLRLRKRAAEQRRANARIEMRSVHGDVFEIEWDRGR